MNARHTLAIALLACIPLSACSDNTPPASSKTAPDQQPTSALGRMVEKEIREAREELAHENINLKSMRIRGNGGRGINVMSDEDSQDTRPKGEITPKGDLLIDGKAVAINAEQRAMLLEYRGHVISVAEAGMAIGVQGADLATKAVGEAFRGIFSGKSEQDIEKAVEAEAEKIKLSATKLCGHLPAMMASQQKLAASIPEFKPYATMTQDDVDSCMKESQNDATHRAEIQGEVREEIRNEIRSAVRRTVRNEAEEAAQAATTADSTKTDANADTSR